MAAVGLDTLAAGEDTHSGKRVRPPRLSLSKGGRWEGESVCVRGGGGIQVVDGWLLGSLLLGRSQEHCLRAGIWSDRTSAS